nr:MAG TPA: hypothetical protein [Caudoviricetes sp.]
MYITFYLGLSLPFFDFMAFATTIYVVIYPNFPMKDWFLVFLTFNV